MRAALAKLPGDDSAAHRGGCNSAQCVIAEDISYTGVSSKIFGGCKVIAWVFSRAQARVKLSARYAFGHAPLRSCSDTALLRAVLEAAPFFRATILQLFEVTS